MNELKWKNWNECIEIDELKWMNWNKGIETNELKWMNWIKAIEMKELEWMNWNAGSDMNERINERIEMNDSLVHLFPTSSSKSFPNAAEFYGFMWPTTWWCCGRHMKPSSRYSLVHLFPTSSSKSAPGSSVF